MALPALAPLMLLIAAAIKITSPGPVLFRQERVGFKGRRFNFLKFRSMRVNADTDVHREHMNQLMRSAVPMVKLDNQQDPRLSPLGRILRSTGLDELPQMINVVRGEMSLVGPRPCIPYEFEDYAPWHKRRCEGLPGLTGLWQVEGKNHTTFDEMVRLDVLYLSRQSPWLDLRIMCKTLPALVSQFRETRARQEGGTRQQVLPGSKNRWSKQAAQL
jgi:exopolysaccharide production protein ExoY